MIRYDRAKLAVAAYTGCQLQGLKLKCEADPDNPNIIAVRSDALGYDWLVRHPFTAETVEDVEFTSWPPTVRP